jgi:hypothetical protein
MTVFVAGKLIQKSSSLSDLLRQTLAFVDGGAQWLEVSMSSPSASYSFADETALLAKVQQGLHASSMTILSKAGLWVSPVKLMTLGSAHLATLSKVENGDTSDAVLHELRRILDDNDLLTAQQIAGAGTFLDTVGVRTAPLFQALDFDSSVALIELVAPALGPPDGRAEKLCREAAAFAEIQARTVHEFCDYYQLYLALAAKMDALDSDASVREQLAQQAMQTLLPLAFGAIDCPQLPDRLPAPAEVDTEMHRLIASGYKIGFSRLSLAVLQMVTQTVFTTETGSAAARMFDLYLSTARAFLAANHLAEGRLGQDGASLVFTLHNETQQAQLQVSPNRLLSLRCFGAWAPPDANPVLSEFSSTSLTAE